MKKSEKTNSAQMAATNTQEAPSGKKYARRTTHQRPLTSKSKNYQPGTLDELNRYRPATAPALQLSHHLEKHSGDTATNAEIPFKRDAISERAHALLKRMKPKYFPTNIQNKPEHDFDEVDIHLTSKIVKDFKKKMLLTPEERVEKRKIDYEFAKYYKAHRIPTRDI